MNQLVSFLLLFGLLGLNALFVAAEFALVRARRERLEAAAKSGARGAARALDQLVHIDRSLSACQLGITMASIGIGWVGEPALAGLLEPLLGQVLGHGVAVALAFVMAYGLITGLHITVGEQVPKVYALARADRVARWLSWPLHLFERGLHPAIWCLQRITALLLRGLGIADTASLEEAQGPEELRQLIARSRAQGHLDHGEAYMLSGVFELHERQARSIMTPMHDVATCEHDQPVREALEVCANTGHTRLPVMQGENLAGVIHVGQLLESILGGQEQQTVGPLAREPLVCPETRALDLLLEDLQRSHVSLAVVVDEYGRTVGVVSVEDIVEEIVGEITDETDQEPQTVVREAGGWRAEGQVAVADLEDHGIHLPQDSDAYTSLGGLIMHQLGRVPQVGEELAVAGYRLRVLSLEGLRVEQVRIDKG